VPAPSTGESWPIIVIISVLVADVPFGRDL
jgi:hypothetical protein